MLLLDFSERGERGAGPIVPLELELPDTWPERPCDLGTHVVVERNLLLRGRLLTRQGLPVVGGAAALHERPPDGGWPPDGKKVAGVFAPLAAPRVETDEEGRFAIYGDVEPGDYELRAYSSSHVGVNVELPPGPPWSPIEIRLEPAAPAAALEGRVLVDEGIPVTRLGVYFGERSSGEEELGAEYGSALVREWSPASLKGSKRAVLGLNGEFRRQGLRPEAIDVLVCGAHGLEIPWVHGAILVGGETLTLPTLDLRGRLQLWSIVPLDEGGSLVPSELVLATNPAGTWTYGALERSLDGKRGEIQIVAERHAVLEVRVFAAGGYTPELVTLSNGNPEVTVVLRPWHPGATDGW